MGAVELIGVPFDGYGRAGHQAAAAEVLRAQGLGAAVAPHREVVSSELELPPGNPDRGSATSLINEAALVAMTTQVARRVAAAVTAGRFPLVYGADCTTLLGTVPALRRTLPIGVVFVDGHEDTMPLDVSEDGEAANAEIGLLLGLTGRLLSGPLAEGLPALGRDDLAVLGPRDVSWRRQFNVGSVRDAGVWLRDWREVAADPASAGGSAVRHLRGESPRVGNGRPWWLHVDLDVLDPNEFRAQGLPDVPDEPGGLNWDQLTRTLTAAVQQDGCLGWSLAIYDPDQDPDRTDARKIIDLVEHVIAAAPDGTA